MKQMTLFFCALLLSLVVPAESAPMSSPSKNIQVNFTPILKVNEFESNPMEQFLNWYKSSGNSPELQIMALSTTKNGQSSLCSVWLEDVTEEGFIFHSYPGSPQVLNIQNNSQVALLMLYKDPSGKLYKQVRIEGQAVPIPYQRGSMQVESQGQSYPIKWVSFVVHPSNASFDAFHVVNQVSVQETVLYQYQKGTWSYSLQPNLFIFNGSLK